MYAVPGCGSATKTATIRHTEPIISEESRKSKLSPGSPARSPVIWQISGSEKIGDVTIQDRPMSVKNFPQAAANLFN